MARQRLAGVAVAIALIALVAFIPDGFLRWTFPKYLLIAGAVFVGLFALRTGRLPRRAWIVLTLCFAALVIAAGAGAVATGGDLWTGLVGRWPRYLGPVTALPAVAGAAWIGASFLGPAATVGIRRVFVTGVGAIALAVGVLSTLEAFGLRPIASDLERPGSFFGNATDQGIVSGMLLLVLLAVAVDRATWRDTLLRWAAPVGIASALAGAILSGSRGALLGLGIGALMLAFLVWRLRVLGGRVVLVGAALLLAFGTTLALLLPGVGDRFTGADELAATTASERWMLWSLGVQAWETAPIIGGGAGSAVDRFPALHDTAWYLERPVGTTLESAHNWMIDLALDGGLLLLGIVLVGIVLMVRDAARAVRIRPGLHAQPLAVGSASALVAASVALFFHPTGPAVLLLAALLGGVLVSRPYASPRAGFGPAIATISIRVGVGIWIALLAASTIAEVPLARGMEAARAGDAEGAAAAFALASALRPADADVDVIAAQTLTSALVSGDTAAADPASTWTASALERLPTSAAALDARATTLEQLGDIEAAVGIRETQLRHAPADPNARLNLAIDLSLLGEWEAAATQADQVLAQDPGSAGAAGLLRELCTAGFAPAC